MKITKIFSFLGFLVSSLSVLASGEDSSGGAIKAVELDLERCRQLNSLINRFVDNFIESKEREFEAWHKVSLALIEGMEKEGLDAKVVDAYRKEESIKYNSSSRIIKCKQVDQPDNYPLRIPARLESQFCSQVTIEESQEEMEAALMSYGIIPFRPLRHNKLILGTGNRPTAAAGRVSSKHYEGESFNTKDAFPDADTIDISAAMNPTIVADVNQTGWIAYLEKEGKMYEEIGHHSVECGLPLREIKRILRVGGIYKVRGVTLFIYLQSMSGASLEYIQRKARDERLWLEIPVPVEDETYSQLDLKAIKEVPALLVEKINDILRTEGFEFVLNADGSQQRLELGYLQEVRAGKALEVPSMLLRRIS